MPRVVHIIGNGPSAKYYQAQERKGLKLTCNIPPFEVPDAYCTVMVDFKMMKALTEKKLTIPGEWMLGYRPKIWMQQNPQFHMMMAPKIKGFYLKLPKYAKNYTDFNCGHMATHYACTTFKPDIVYMWGFDSVFDLNLTSSADKYLSSPRDDKHNVKLSDNWRPIWQNMFKEFSDTQFVMSHGHSNIKFKVPSNVKIDVYTDLGGGEYKLKVYEPGSPLKKLLEMREKQVQHPL